MCEQTEINYLDGDIVWVKLGACWWPGQVTSLHNLPEDIQVEFQKKPLIAAVKFFQEDTYEFVKNYQQIYKYNCTLKDEFIKKGLDKYRSKNKDASSYMDKFPGDVEMAEKLTGGDPEILSQEKFCPEEKPDISALFGEKKISKKKRDGREDGYRRSDGPEVARKITHPRFLGGESDHEVRIRQQPSSLPSTPTNTDSPQYLCHLCNFTSSRVNVIICHIKSHRSDSPSSTVQQSRIKTYSQSHSGISNASTPKRKYVKKDKNPSNKKESGVDSGKRKYPKQNSEKANKKKKTDPELREKLLADWEDESDEETSLKVNSPLTSGSPAKKELGLDNGKEFKEKADDTATDNNKIIAETEKLLKETEELSIHMRNESSLDSAKNLRTSSFDKKSEFEKDIKTGEASNEAFVKSLRKDILSSDGESKNVSDKDDKKSRLSCFDFDEDDLSEPSIPPVRKIPRVFGEKNLSLKKEIIKEFEMSQALKNEIKKDTDKIATELGSNMELKADEIIEIIQGSAHLEEKKDIKVSERSDESMQDKIEVEQSERVNEKNMNNEQKSNINTCETEVEIVEIFEVEREDGNSDHSSKRTEKRFKTATSSKLLKANEASEKNEVLVDAFKINDNKLLQYEKMDSEGIIITTANEDALAKEADDTLSERFTTETEDETVSESAETMPEQSENSDMDTLDRNVDFSKSQVAEMPIKRGRGRPRKNARSINRGGGTDKSPRARAGRGSKRFRVSEGIEIDRKTSDSDTDRSYSGRKRKPNKKYLESDIYLQDSDYKAFRTDESQSESDDKVSEKITGKSRRGRRPKAIESKGSEFVSRMDKQEIEITDQTLTVTVENNVSSIEMPKSNISRQEVLLEKFEEEPEEIERDLSKELVKSLDEATAAKVANVNVSSKDAEVTSKTDEIDKSVGTLSEAKEKKNSVKRGEDSEENIKDEEKLMIVQQAENTSDKIQQDNLKTIVDMLPPKKSQIKKFELSQIDFSDADVQVNKTVEMEFESESTLEPESNSHSETENVEEKINKDKIEAKVAENKITDKIAKLLNTGNEEQVAAKNVKIELRTKLEKPDEKEKEAEPTKIMQEINDTNRLESKSPKKSSMATKSENANDALKTVAKVTSNEQLSTPTRSSMQTRYKGRFTPETGAKGRKDKDILEEKPVHTFQEAFLKTLQMDKRIMEDPETSKGKKVKKTAKKQVEQLDANITVTTAQGAKPDESSNSVVKISENIQTEVSVSDIESNFENVKIIAEEKLKIVETTGQLASPYSEFVIVSSVAENNANTDVKKLEEASKISVPMLSSLPSPDISVPVKKREMPRIIENVTLTEPVQILKTKLIDKLPQKGAKHKLDTDVAKKGDAARGSPKAKIMKIETLRTSNNKTKTNAKSSATGSPQMSLTRKLQVLKTEETDALLEVAAASEKQNVPTTQTLITTDKYIQSNTQSLADMELDINSMPFVLSEDVLTPESIEQMPVVISSIIPASSSISASATTLTLTPTAQTAQFKIASEGAATTESVSSSSVKKKSGVPTILKNKKAKPTITSVKTLVPPLTGGVKGLKFQSASKTPPLLTTPQKGAATPPPGKYVVVQTGSQQLCYSVQGKSGTPQKIAIPTGKPTGTAAAGNAQVVQQGGKVVILTSAQSCQTKMVPLNISKTLSGKMQRIVTSKGQVLCPINPQGSIITSKTVIAPKTDAVAVAASSPTTSKLATTGHKIINTQGIITSKGMLTPITGAIAKTTLLGTLSQGILTKGGIYTPISASALSGKTIIGSKTLVTKGAATLLSPQNLGGAKAILTPVSQTIPGKTTILSTQAIVGRQGTVLTPITGQQVKAIAAKSPTKGGAGGKVQYQPVQQKVQLQPILQKPPKMPISVASTQTKTSAALKSPSNTLVVQNNAAPSTITQKGIVHGKKIIKQTVVQPTVQSIASSSGTQQTTVMTMVSQVQPKSGGKAVPTVQKVIIPRGSGSRQTKTQQKIVMQKVQEPTAASVVHAKQTATVSLTGTSVATKTVVQSKPSSSPATVKSPMKSIVGLGKVQNQSKNLLAMNSISTATATSANINTTLTLPPLQPFDMTEKKTKDSQPTLVDAGQKEQGRMEKVQAEKSGDVIVEKIEEPKISAAAQPQIMALPTESGDGTQTYVLVTIDEHGQIQPLDNNTLMSLEGTTQNPDGTRTLYIDPSSLGETGTLDNIVLQFDNSILPSIQTNATTTMTTESSQTIITQSFPTSEMIHTSNQDILAAALANTDFQQEISLPENQATSDGGGGGVMTAGLTQTSLINQTILQSTIIPPTEPISSPSVLETSLTLNQPIMTPLEVPSNLSIQSDSTPTSSSVVSTIPSSLELPITITNPNISYISAGETTQIQAIPGNSMPDIGELMESGPMAGGAAGTSRAEEIPVSTQYLVIPSLEEDNNAVTETQSSKTITLPSVSYSVTVPSGMILESSQVVQTTPSMPIIDDTYTDNVQFAATSIAAEQAFADVPVSEMMAPENAHPRDIVTSETVVSSRRILVSPQKSRNKTKCTTDDESVVTMQEIYSSQEVPITSEELILQSPAKEINASSSSSSNAMEVTCDDKESGSTPMADCLPMIKETALVTSDSHSKLEQASFEATDSSEPKSIVDSHDEANTVGKLKQMTVSERSSDKLNSVDPQVTAAALNQAETMSQILLVGSLKPSGDVATEVDEEELYADATKRSADCQSDVPLSSQDNVKGIHFEEEETSTEAISREIPSQSYDEQRFASVSVASDSADLPSQSAATKKKKTENSVEATQSIAYEPMETDEEEATQSFEHRSKMNEASRSYEEEEEEEEEEKEATAAETNVNRPTQSFNELMQCKEADRPSYIVDDEAEGTSDDQSFPTQSYEVDKGESARAESLEIEGEISQEGNMPSQSNDISADGIGTSSISTNNSGLNEDETASSSYVPETPENQERDQEDQESAISTSSYEIPPCEELNIASSSVIPDTSEHGCHGVHDNGVPEIPTSSYNLNPDITSTHHVSDSGPTSNYEEENQVIVEQNVSTSYDEVPISMPGLDETCSQNLVAESTDRRNEPSSYYARHREVTASYYESVDRDANSQVERGRDTHEEVTPGYYEGNPQEVSQSYFASTEETPSYTSHGISPGYYDPRHETEASQSYYSTDELEKSSTSQQQQQQLSSPNIEATQSFYQERTSELRLRQRGEATPTYTEGYPVDYTLENSPIERHDDLVESSVPASRSMER